MPSLAPNERFLLVNPGDRVLAYCEKKGWQGRYKFISNAGKLALVFDSNNREHTFRVTQIKPYPDLFLPRPHFRSTDLNVKGVQQKERYYFLRDTAKRI